MTSACIVRDLRAIELLIDSDLDSVLLGWHDGDLL
jgi:hypothetical protein